MLKYKVIRIGSKYYAISQSNVKFCLVGDSYDEANSLAIRAFKFYRKRRRKK